MNRKSGLTDDQIRRFHRLLSVRMIDFDCGKLCAPNNNGVPYCCDRESVIPVLFSEEYNWHRKKKKFWEKMPVRTEEDREFVEDSYPYYAFSVCPGHKDCIRSMRSLNCMTYPFEPQVSRDGTVLGLIYQDQENGPCSLKGKPERIYNPKYISNAIQYWQEVIDSIPDEKDMYIDESRRRERRYKRKGLKIKVFRAKQQHR